MSEAAVERPVKVIQSRTSHHDDSRRSDASGSSSSDELRDLQATVNGHILELESQMDATARANSTFVNQVSQIKGLLKKRDRKSVV